MLYLPLRRRKMFQTMLVITCVWVSLLVWVAIFVIVLFLRFCFIIKLPFAEFRMDFGLGWCRQIERLLTSRATFSWCWTALVIRMRDLCASVIIAYTCLTITSAAVLAALFNTVIAFLKCWLTELVWTVLALSGVQNMVKQWWLCYLDLL